jgi:Mn-dependent DtxR family transcriptional regulator
MSTFEFTSMPISIDEFESHDPEKRETNAERVVRFLAGNRDKAYKAVEIAEATGVDENSIHPVLNRLEERGLVRHREPYWAIRDVEEVHSAMVFSSTAEFLDDVLGPESREEWLRASEDEERKQS